MAVTNRTKKTYAVLTGDLVRSTDLEAKSLARVRQSVGRSVETADQWRRRTVRQNVEFVRGDEWQAALSEPAYALRTALLIRAQLKAHFKSDTRISIGIGSIDKFSRRSIFESSGEAFTLSGRALDDIGGDRLAITFGEACAASFHSFEHFTSKAILLCDAILDDWTPRQAELVATAMASPTPLRHEDIAKGVKTSRQAVQKSLDSAHWGQLDAFIRAFEAINWRAA